ncbi:oxidoreductase [Amycolatopsis sp. CA-230715]|uniref:oxidoreductase n=1 Tax=Amycolatopsis sp. CA-230715 TaxID=2745196 RepID=UPI0020B3EACD|nr:oxidoreductase [Amycolatopsis sp. CA-230715]
MRTFVIGLGRAGAGLHIPILTRIREGGGPILVFDPAVESGDLPPGVVSVPSIERAARSLDPAGAVTHLCTPPGSRSALLDELATAGFRRFVLEKPIATNDRELRRIVRLRARNGLRFAVVAPWLAAALTGKLARIVRDGTLGALRAITVHQHKPRFHRSLTTSGHPTAFDVEIPHAIPVVLRLAGPAELTAAKWRTLSCEEGTIPRLGGASLTLEHHSGVRTELVSDLTSPIRERRMRLEFAEGTVTADYPVGEDDDHAQLTVTTGGPSEHRAFRDDALTAFFVGTYRRFGRPSTDTEHLDFALHCETVRLLSEAKSRCATIPVQSRAEPQYAR